MSANKSILRALPGYPFFPCKICQREGFSGADNDGCDHTVGERARAMHPTLVLSPPEASRPLTYNKTRISNDMRRAQAETVSEERLKHMANSPAHVIQGSAPVSLRSGELRGMAEEILASRQALRAHPLPNPSPSDGEVSDEEVQRAGQAFIDCPDHRSEKFWDNMRIALQASKRGQP